MKLKQWFIAGVLGLSLVGLAACGKSTKAASDNKLSIGILQQIDQSALDSLRSGFKAELAKQGYGSDKVTLQYLNANGDQSNLASMSDKLARQHNKVNIAIATAAAQAMQKADTTTPLLFTGVADAVGTGLLKQHGVTNGNVSGVSATSNEAVQIDMLHKLFPKAKRIGMLYNAAEANSLLHVKNAKKEMKKLGLTPVEKTVTSTNDVQTAAEALADQSDAFYLPADNVVAAAMPTVAKIVDQKHIPVIPGDASMVKVVGVAGQGIDFTAVGKQTADMAIRLLKGEKISKVTPEDAKVSDLMMNQQRMKTYGITAAEVRASVK